MSLDRIGKYRVVAKIGEGAMGEVYKAHDPLLNRHVAVKTIAPSLASDPQFRERFKHEAQSAGGLNHPNIITVYDFGEDAGVTYLAMEFLDGGDLREAIKSRALTHLGRKIEVMEQLCEGIGFAHARGVVHRDLKPGNIHIQSSGHVKVLDFGLARLAASDMTRTGTVMGTPHYMSPEQLRGQKADARSDVFALGAIFYELLSGVRAFEGQPMHEVLQHLREKDPVPLRQRAPATPLPLVAIVEKAMARDPAARFKDAGEMGRALVRAREELAGETLAAPLARDDAAERTVLQAAGATILEPRRPAVHGTAALDVGRHHEPQRTVRPDPTVAGGPRTEVGGAGRRLRPLAVGGVLLVLAGISAALWLRRGPQAPAGGETAAPAAADQVGMITDVVVTSKLELARADLEGKDYAAAAASAREALQFDPANADATALLQQAEAAQREIESAVAAARAAVGRGDTKQGVAALGQVLRLDPRNPVADELKASLNQAFRQEADAARRLSGDAQAAADKAHAAAIPVYAAARTLAAQAETSFAREDYTAAAQKFFGARDGFDAARRAADAARVAAAAPTPRPAAVALASAPPPPPSTTMPAYVAPSALPQPSLAPPRPLAPAPVPSATSTAPPPAAVASAAPPDSSDAAVRRVIADYERAIEGQDIGLFRSLKPSLTADEEKRLREAFKAVKSQDVGIVLDSVQLQGDQATVHVHRQDTVNGRKMNATQQVFRLTRTAGAWQITSIGQ